MLFSTNEAKEGMKAFLEKRNPQWSNWVKLRELRKAEKDKEDLK